MKRIFSLLFIVVLACATSFSQDATSLSDNAADWKNSAARNLLNQIQTEHNAMQTAARQFADRQDEITQKTNEFKRQADSQEDALNETKAKLTEQNARLQQLEAQIQALNGIADEILEVVHAPSDNDLAQTLDSILDDISKSLACNILQEEAKLPDGQIVKGELLRSGPVSLFKPADGRPAGILTPQPNVQVPVFFNDFSKKEILAINDVFQGKEAIIPVDVTGGKALLLHQNTDSALEHFRKGGVIMIPLAVLALCCVGILFWKILTLNKLPNKNTLETFIVLAENLQQNNHENARTLCGKLPPQLRKLGEIACDANQAKLDKDALEERLYTQALLDRQPPEHLLGLLAVCASSAPLLGLLGTVTGMIHTFSLITVYGTGDARLLSSGISEALITTEVGLIIAIPALLGHAWCVRRTRRFSALQQSSAATILSHWKS